MSIGKAVHALMMIGLLAFGGAVAWWYTDDVLPYNYLRGVIRPDPAREGGRVLLVWDIDQPKRLCPGVVQRTLIDHRSGRTLATYDPLPASQTVEMGDREIRKSFIVPDDMFPNAVPAEAGEVEVRYMAKVCFRCNPLDLVMTQRLCATLPPVLFHVKRLQSSELEAGKPR